MKKRLKKFLKDVKLTCHFLSFKRFLITKTPVTLIFLNHGGQMALFDPNVGMTKTTLLIKMLHWVDTIISNAKAYILGTYHGLPKKYLQRYLDEFCYRLNRRFSERVIFYKLVDACLLLGPITFIESSL